MIGTDQLLRAAKAGVLLGRVTRKTPNPLDKLTVYPANFLVRKEAWEFEAAVNIFLVSCSTNKACSLENLAGENSE